MSPSSSLQHVHTNTSCAGAVYDDAVSGGRNHHMQPHNRATHSENESRAARRWQRPDASTANLQRDHHVFPRRLARFFTPPTRTMGKMENTPRSTYTNRQSLRSGITAPAGSRSVVAVASTCPTAGTPGTGKRPKLPHRASYRTTPSSIAFGWGKMPTSTSHASARPRSPTRHQRALVEGGSEGNVKASGEEPIVPGQEG